MDDDSGTIDVEYEIHEHRRLRKEVEESDRELHQLLGSLGYNVGEIGPVNADDPDAIQRHVDELRTRHPDNRRIQDIGLIVLTLAASRQNIGLALSTALRHLNEEAERDGDG